MKKTIALLLVAMLLGIGLVVSCGGGDDDPEPTPTTPAAVKYKVTFDSDGRPFADGTTVAKVVEVEKDATVGNKWPEIDEENIGTDVLQGWFDGDTQVMRTTKITKDVTLKAKYDAALFTFDTSSHAAIHTNFVISVSPGGTHSNWDGEEKGGNEFVIKTGGIRYKYPVTVGFDYNDYDFVEVEYTASAVAGLVLKQYGSADGYEAFSGGISNTAEGEKKIVTWELRQGVEGGFTIQKWNANVPEMTIQITKITFIQRTRYKIKFDTDGGAPVPADSYLVDGTKVGNYLPANVTKANSIFTGWVNGATAVNADTTVNSSFNNATLKALWLADIPSLTSKTITFPDLTGFRIIKGSDQGDPTIAALTGDDEGKGFKVGNLNYEWRLVAFKVTLDANVTLAHYDEISFDFDQTVGYQTNYKSVFVAAAPATGDNAFKPPTAASYIGTKAVTNTVASQALTSLTFTITKPVAASLKGDIEVCIYIPAGGEGDRANGPYVIKNIVFVKK